MALRTIASGADLECIVDDFCRAASLAGVAIERSGITAEFYPAPHRRPNNLPKFHQAVYGFIVDGCCLKVGKAGPSTAARYTSQHYNSESSSSNLAKSLLAGAGRLKGRVRDDVCAGAASLSRESAGAWIERSTSRFNILIGAQFEEYELSFLESFIQCRLKPLYEGRAR